MVSVIVWGVWGEVGCVMFLVEGGEIMIILEEGVYVFEMFVCYDCVYSGYILIFGVLWLVDFV